MNDSTQVYLAIKYAQPDFHTCTGARALAWLDSLPVQVLARARIILGIPIFIQSWQHADEINRTTRRALYLRLRQFGRDDRPHRDHVASVIIDCLREYHEQ